MTIRDAQVPLGTVADTEGTRREVRRDFDALDLSSLSMPLPPAGVRELERAIAGYWNELARYRLRECDLSGFDLDRVRDSLVFIGEADSPFTGKASLEDADWNSAGRKLARLPGMGGLDELRRFHAFLTGDRTPPELEAPDAG